MQYLDLLLNLVGLLIWINWRSLGFVRPASALSLASAIKPTGKAGLGNERKLLLAGLAGLLFFRALLYRQFGPPLDWTPQLDFGVLIISMKCERFRWMLLYSFLSFGMIWAVFHYWLLFLAAVNHQVPDHEPQQKLVRLHLGSLARWPSALQFALPMLITALAWPVFYWVFTRLGLMPGARDSWHLAQQSAVVGAAALLGWKYFLTGLMLLYLLNSYIYFGAASFWNFIALTGKNMLSPLRWMVMGRIDLSPLLGIALVMGTGELLAYYLPKLYQRLPF